MRRSRSLSTESASPSAFLRLSDSSLSTSRVSWSETSSTGQSCHSPQSPSSRIGELSDTSPSRRRFMSITSGWVTPSCRAMIFTWSGRMSPWSSTEMLLLALRRLKNSFFWLTVVPHLHQRPRTQDVFLDRRLDPPRGIGGEPEALVRLEAFDRLHQADVALRD